MFQPDQDLRDAEIRLRQIAIRNAHNAIAMVQAMAVWDSFRKNAEIYNWNYSEKLPTFGIAAQVIKYDSISAVIAAVGRATDPARDQQSMSLFAFAKRLMNERVRHRCSGRKQKPASQTRSSINPRRAVQLLIEGAQWHQEAENTIRSHRLKKLMYARVVISEWRNHRSSHQLWVDGGLDMDMRELRRAIRLVKYYTEAANQSVGATCDFRQNYNKAILSANALWSKIMS